MVAVHTPFAHMGGNLGSLPQGTNVATPFPAGVCTCPLKVPESVHILRALPLALALLLQVKVEGMAPKENKAGFGSEGEGPGGPGGARSMGPLTGVTGPPPIMLLSKFPAPESWLFTKPCTFWIAPLAICCPSAQPAMVAFFSDFL